MFASGSLSAPFFSMVHNTSAQKVEGQACGCSLAVALAQSCQFVRLLCHGR